MLALSALLMLQAPEPIGPPAWTAQWIWGSVHEDGGLGFFRKVFELPAGCERLVVQMSGDDSYEAFFDGHSVAKGGFWWNTTDTHDLGPAAAGQHVIAAKVNNAARPGGLLLEAWAVGEGLWQCIATDKTWLFSGDAPEALAQLGFDDSGWEHAREIGPPPVSPWGKLPIRFVGPTLELELLDSRIDLKDRSVTAHAAIRVVRAEPHARLVGLELVREDRVFARTIVPVDPRPETWRAGDRVEIEGSAELGPFVPAGDYEVHFGPYGATYGEDTSMKVGTVTLSVRDVDYPLVTIGPHNGAPGLFIDGTPIYPLMLMSCPVDPRDIADGAADGLHLQTIGAASGWAGIGKYEYAETDRAIQTALEADPDALLLLRVMMSAPSDWLDAHPDEIVRYADPASWQNFGLGGARHPSYASTLWRTDASEALRRLVRHIREAGWADHILGFHIAAGIYGEWHYWNAPYYPDSCPTFERAYAEWLRREYPDHPPGARIPTIEERRHGDVGMFRDPAKSRWLIDYQRFLHLQGAESLIAMAKAVKEESRGRCLTLAFNGYLPDLNWNPEGDHRRFDLALRSPYLDAFASPHSYGRRGVGQDATMRGFPESVRAMGKLWFDEEDDRTSLASDPAFTHVTSVEDSVEILWRGFAQALTHSAGLWYMDQQGGWYRDPAIHKAFARMEVVADESMTHERTRDSRVAVVASFENAWYLADRSSGLDHVTNALINPQMEQLSLCGAPFDLYLITEAFEPGVPDYDAYVFLDTFHMTDEQYTKVRSLVERGKTVLFFYAPGFVSDRDLSLERMRALVGQPVEMTEEMTLATGESQKPGFPVPGLEQPVARSGNVWYCPSPPLAADRLRAILREAGVRIYIDSGDPLMVGAGYVAVHAASDGEKTIHAPRPVTWVDARTGARLATAVDSVTVTMRRGQTLLLEMR